MHMLNDSESTGWLNSKSLVIEEGSANYIWGLDRLLKERVGIKLSRKAVSILVLVLLVMSLAKFAFNIQIAKALETITIGAGGSIDPPSAPITRDGRTYTFTDNVFDTRIWIMTDDIIVDGAGYSVTGTGMPGNAWGIRIFHAHNVTIRNMTISGWYIGIELTNAPDFVLSGSNVEVGAGSMGIEGGLSPRCNLCDNILTSMSSSSTWGIILDESDNCNVSNNSFTGDFVRGICLYDSSNCSVFCNSFENSYVGIELAASSDNHIFHNNFVNNTNPAEVGGSEVNIWDDGYPSGGNYWSSYAGMDHFSGPYQDEAGSDLIGDTPYVIGTNNQDRYPLMYGWPFKHDIAITSVATSKTVVGQSYNSDINVTVTNQGDYIETFNVTTYYNLTDYTEPPGLVGHWKLDEGSGTTVRDSSGCNNDGTVYGASWVDGRSGSALSFDGTDDYVFISDSPSLRVTNLTVMAWVYSPIPFVNQQKDARIVSKEYNGYLPGAGYGLYVREPGYVHCELAYSTSAWAIDLGSSFILQEGYWHHVAFTYNHSQIRLYIDGELDASTSFAEDIIHSDWGVYIGGNPLGLPVPQYFKGKIDDVRIYNRALDEDGIETASHALGTRTITLEGGDSTTLTFTWNTTGFAKGNYTIGAYAGPVPDETNTTDNFFTDGWVYVSMVGDINADSKVDVKDAYATALAYGTSIDGPNPEGRKYNPNCDINDDGKVDIKDYYIVCRHYGEVDP